MADRDFYEVLGLTPSADGAAIDRAYWQLARRYQAEAVNDPRASALLDELNEAYNVLGVPYMRAEYDSARREALAEVAGQGRRRRKGARRRQPVPQASLSVPPPVIIAAVAVTLLLGGLGAAWAAGYGIAALVVGVCFVAGAGGAYILLGNADALFDRVRTTAPQARPERQSERQPERQPEPVERDTRPASPPREPRPAATRSEPAPRPARPAPARIRASKQDAGALRDSVASTRERWRKAATAVEAQTQAAPDTTLVEIFSSEKELEAREEPLSAVMDILRGARAEEDSSTHVR